MMYVKLINETQLQYAPKSVVIGDKRIYNPNENTLKRLGFKPLIKTDMPSPYFDYIYLEEDECIKQVWIEWDGIRKKDYCDALIEQKIAEKYTLAQEVAILRQKDEKPDEYLAWYNYTEQCKVEAKKELALIAQEIEYVPKEELISATEERINQIEKEQYVINDRIEFVEDCLIEMSETVYGG